ncbi:murein hydrolase activator EnvC family protein [Nitrospira sp. Nam74]
MPCRAMAVMIVCGLMITAPVYAGKDRKDPLAEKIERERRTLEKLQQEIENKKKHAQETEKKKESVLQAIQDLDDTLLLKRQERTVINRKLKEKDQEIERINDRLGDVRRTIANRRQSILARLRVQYMEGRFRHLGALLAADNYEAFQQRLQYLSAVSQREYDLIEGYREDLDRLQHMERQRAVARDEMLVMKYHTDRKVGEIQGLKRKKNVILASITQQKEAYEHALAELERSATRVDGLLKELEARRKTAAFQLPKDLKGGHPLKGGMHWPVDGEIVSFFGRQKHPTFNTYVQRKGIEIRTDEGSAIRSVMSGVVVFADWLKGYGQVVILDHANGFFSLYAHASKLLVKVGEQVAMGYVIGETGDTGLTGDSTLYFELRQGAQPVDPLTWLAKRR